MNSNNIEELFLKQLNDISLLIETSQCKGSNNSDSEDDFNNEEFVIKRPHNKSKFNRFSTDGIYSSNSSEDEKLTGNKTPNSVTVDILTTGDDLFKIQAPKSKSPVTLPPHLKQTFIHESYFKVINNDNSSIVSFSPNKKVESANSEIFNMRRLFASTKQKLSHSTARARNISSQTVREFEKMWDLLNEKDEYIHQLEKQCILLKMSNLSDENKKIIDAQTEMYLSSKQSLYQSLSPLSRAGKDKRMDFTENVESVCSNTFVELSASIDDDQKSIVDKETNMNKEMIELIASLLSINRELKNKLSIIHCSKLE